MHCSLAIDLTTLRLLTFIALLRKKILIGRTVLRVSSKLINRYVLKRTVDFFSSLKSAHTSTYSLDEG